MKMLQTPTAETNGNGHHEHDVLDEETLLIEPDDAPPKVDKGKGKRKPLWPLLIIAVVLLALLLIVGFVVLGGFQRSTEVTASVQTQPPSPEAAITQRQEADKIADKLVNSTTIVDARRDAPAEPQIGADGAPVPGVDKSVTVQPGDGSTLPAGAAGTVATQPQAFPSGSANSASPSASPAPSSTAPASSRAATQQAQGPRLASLPSSAANAQQSFRYKPVAAAGRAGRGDGSAGATGDPFDSTYSFNGRTSARGDVRGPAPASAVLAAPVVPPFDATLPVRTLGALYTLRSSGTVRLELARDVQGRGWALRRGTVLVATLKGSDVDRAFLAVTGYIHPETGGFVRFGGEVRGLDGADGLKGKRRTVGSAWARGLSELARTGRDLLQSALAGRNGGTTIVNGQDPLSAELGGLQARNQRREFVEVEAGTFGYVKVTDLPAEVDGQPPAPPESLPGQLSDAEIAALMTAGTPEQIRAALPRMAPGMRALAESVLRQAGER